MGTLFRIVLYAPDEAAAKKAADAGFERIAQLDNIMSDYKETSELMQLCQKAGGEPVKISEDLFFILSKSQDVAKQSEGAFDVTVGPVVRLWRRARRQKELPDKDRLAAALELVGYDKLKLDLKNRTAQLTKRGMLLDLGGIAKGHAADEAQAVLKKHGIKSALVAAGGDVVVSAAPPGTEGWTVGIAPLDHPDKPPTRFLLLKDAAVSTSGDAEQFVEIDGKRYSHIVDPKTGVGLIGHASVTVVAPNGTASDSLATAVSVLGPDKGLKLIDAGRNCRPHHPGNGAGGEGGRIKALEGHPEGNDEARMTKAERMTKPE
jgi:thiamine biosynthesis lipoprotein